MAVMLTRFRAVLVAIALGVFVAAPAFALQSDRSAAIDAAKSTYDKIRAAIDEREIDDIAAAEEQIRALREESRGRLGLIERELETARSQLEPLGPAPGETDPPESEELAAQRAALNENVARLASERTRVSANIIEANDLLSRLSATQLQGLYQRLLTRETSPLAPGVWGPAYQSAANVAGKIGVYFGKWSEGRRESNAFGPSLGFIIGALIVSLLIFGPVDRWISTTFSAAIEKRRPTRARRIVAAGLKMIARTAPGLIGGFIIVETLRAQGVITEAGEPAARALWFGLIAYLLISGFTRGLFAPSNPDWGIAAVDASRARTASNLIIAIVIVFGLKVLLVEIVRAAAGADELATMINASSAVVVGLIFFTLCRTRLWKAAKTGAAKDADGEESASAPEHEDADPADPWRLVRRTGRALAILIIVAAVVGYVSLADFIASRIYYLALFLSLGWFLRAMLGETAFWLRNRLQADESSSSSDDEQKNAQNFRFWSALLINIALFVALTPAVLVLFGVPSSAVLDLAGQALFGFDVGRVRIPSLANIALAIGIFVAVMALTRVVQTGFQRGVFAHSHIDPGVQNSLTTLMGYVGLLVAIFASVSTIGFDLSNLALIAGALSVGIGFGLQSIVNNFVSGLILLFERPIKVGDWIVTASGEGIVRKISVRSTEIVTFDRSSIIVPNSELISSTVTNWTHKDKIGRVIVPVGVSYGADPDKVREILLKCAHDHPLVVRYPEPFVVWLDFGASSLDFEIRAFLADISNGLTVKTELRYAIFKALAEAGIEIPFPQRDVHIKSLPEGFAAAREPRDA